MTSPISRRAALASGIALGAAASLPVGPARAQGPVIDTDAALAERALGSDDAPVTIIEYSSLGCPFCARFHAEILPAVKEQFIETGEARLVFRDFPLDRTSLDAHVLARCVDDKRYFSFLDILFRNQPKWSRGAGTDRVLAQYAQLAGLAPDRVQACLTNETLRNGVVELRADGDRLYAVSATPTFILTRTGSPDPVERIEGLADVATFGEMIAKVANSA